jgi:prepilin-type N-terminal cleavage/methylation domain-containing protein
MIRRNRIPATRRAAQRGMSLVELLVVAAILGFGLLGLAALQALTIKAASGSRQRVAAAYVAHSVLDRIAMEGAQSYFYNTSGQPVPAAFTRVYTAAAASGNVGSFNINGTFLSSSMTAPDGVIQASWERLAPKGAAPVAGAPQIHEYLVNVAYLDGQQSRWLSASRLIRH